jgi:plastocyanin
MAKIPIFDAVRIIPREEDFLNRKLGSRGEIFYDREANTLRLFDGNAVGGISLAKDDLSNIDNLIFKNKAGAAGVGGGAAEISDTPPNSPNSGETWVDETTGIFYVYYDDGTSAQWIQPAAALYGGGSSSGVSTLNSLTDVIISSAVDGQVLKYNGTNWVNAADATSSAGAASNSFTTISVAGQSSVLADSSTDTLTLVAGTGITLTTNASTDTITINSTASAGATTFAALTDVAGLTVDQFYLPAITRLAVTANGSIAYRFDQYTTVDNPTIYVISGTTIAFDLSVGLSSHPFLIQTNAGTNYDVGLTHVTTSGTVTTGASAQGKTSGTLYWKIPAAATGNYRYQCSNHGSMVGLITVKTISAI